jgi:serine/threonine protein kinase
MQSYFLTWIGKSLDSRYEIKSILANGGMGAVLLASDNHLHKEVVIKVPFLRNSNHFEELIQRFKREIHVLSILEHPNIVPIMDAGFFDEYPFLVLRYINDGTLRSKMEKARLHNNAYSLENFLHWLPQISSALDFIHSNNWFHRDVKPENILFDSNYNPYLTDFGVSKNLSFDHENSSRSVFGSFIGSPQYMAPEQHLGETITGKSDQFALAVIIYECISGKLPFSGINPVSIFLEIIKQSVIPLKKHVEKIPLTISNAVMKALSLDPDQRFESCGDLCSIIIEELKLLDFHHDNNEYFHFHPIKVPHAPEVVDSQMVLEIQAFCLKLISSKTLTKNLYKELRVSLAKFRKDEHLIAKMILDVLDFYTMSGLIEPTNIVEIIGEIKKIIPFLTITAEVGPSPS